MTTATSPGMTGQTVKLATARARYSGCGGSSCSSCSSNGGNGKGRRRRPPRERSSGPPGVSIRQVRSPQDAVEGIADEQVDVVIYDTPGNEQAFRAEFERLVKRLGGAQDPKAFGTIREIKVDPRSTKSIAMAAGAHPDHTDGTFDETAPSHFVLGVKTPDTDPNSGRTVLKSVRHLLDKIPAEYAEALKFSEISYSRIDEDGRVDSYNGHILEELASGEVAFRWRDDDQVQPEVIDDAGYPIHEAIEWIRAYLRETVGVRLTLQRGQILIIRNFRVTHGRDPLSGMDSPRVMLRAWVTRN